MVLCCNKLWGKCSEIGPVQADGALFCRLPLFYLSDNSGDETNTVRAPVWHEAEASLWPRTECWDCSNSQGPKRRGCACELWCSKLVIYVCMHALFCDGSHIDQFFFFYWKSICSAAAAVRGRPAHVTPSPKLSFLLFLMLFLKENHLYMANVNVQSGVVQKNSHVCG